MEDKLSAVRLSNVTRIENYLHRMGKTPFGWTFTKHDTIFPFRFEEVDLYYWHDLVGSHPEWAMYATIAYLITIFGIKHGMRNRPPFQLKWALFFWNLSLGMFSIMGFVRTLPGFLNVLSMPHGFYNSICAKVEADIPTGFWSWMFILSKLWELGDTVFIVLRKRPLIFLQWYHHIVTMYAVWILGPLLEPISRWYMVLNYGVHSLMYPYFALRTLGYTTPAKFANLITTMQFAQMITGFTVNMTSLYFKQIGEDCVRTHFSIKVFSVLYGSFICLFGKLFYDSVVKCGRLKKNLVGSGSLLRHPGKKAA